MASRRQSVPDTVDDFDNNSVKRNGQVPSSIYGNGTAKSNTNGYIKNGIHKNGQVIKFEFIVRSMRMRKKK